MHLRLALVSALALIPTFAPAASVPADSTITTVTVYGRGALVTREAEVALEAGMQSIVFAGLSDSLDPDLLQVSGSGTAQATILDVATTAAQLESPANARLKELRDQARTVQVEVRMLNDRASVLQGQRDYYNLIRQATVSPQGGKDNPATLPSIASWEQYMTFYTEGISSILAATLDIDRKREEAQARLDVLTRQIEQLDASESREVSNVNVRVNVATAGTMAIKLTYAVDEASWRPTYDVRVASTDKSIALHYGATVSQWSGEDWSGVRLVLSTAQPDRSGNPPELSTWFVDQFVPMPMPAGAPLARPREAGGAASDYYVSNFIGADKLKAQALAVASASVESGLNSATFIIPYAADIPADNADYKVVITSAPLEGEINHLTVPKLEQLAYLRAAVTNTTEFPLIGGEISLFLDGNFVARSTIKTVAPTEKFVLNLGVDEGIAVKRKLLNRRTEDTGVLSRRVKTTYDVLITVQNNRKTAETLVVKDQIPISRNEKIVVTLVEPLARDIIRDEDGTIRWSLNLKPGDKRELALKISIEHPADLKIAGLE